MAVNLLLSYAFHAATDLRKVREKLVCGRLLIDSGAFTAWSKGKPVSIDAYAEYLETWRGCWDHAVTLDVIGNGTATARNTRRLHERGLPVMPVFTRGDKLAEFDAMVREHRYVCVGGLVGLPAPAQRSRVRMLQRRAQDAGGGIHALGIGSMDTLRAARPYSADASSVSGTFRFGTLIYFDGRQLRNVQVTDRAKLAKDATHLRMHGIDLATIARTGRMPGSTERAALVQAMSLAYACADEVLKRTVPVPAPEGLVEHGLHLYAGVGKFEDDGVTEGQPMAELDARLHPGPHLYNSAIGSGTGTADGASHCMPVAELDARLHGPHLYNSITPSFAVDPAAGLDRDMHAADPPGAWTVYATEHRCRARSPLPTA